MPVFTLQTGRLPAPLAQTAIPFVKKAEIAELEPPEGFRFCLVSFNVSAEDSKKTEKILPKNFAVSVPLEREVSDETWELFCNALATDYQDSIIRKVADPDGKLSLNPLDWLAVIADYNDESRKRTNPTQKDVLAWFEREWVPAYMLRVEQRNAETENPLGWTTKEQMQKVIAKYPEYMAKIAKKECFLDDVAIHGVRQSIERFLELDLLSADDKIAIFVIDQCTLHTKREVFVEEVAIASV